jgi:hypothetical protein
MQQADDRRASLMWLAVDSATLQTVVHGGRASSRPFRHRRVHENVKLGHACVTAAPSTAPLGAAP